MHNLAASLRYFFSYVELERMNIGSVVFMFIRKDIIPKLQKQLAAAKSEAEQARLTGLIEEYTKYSDPRKPESKIYDKTAANIVRANAARSRMNDQDQEDLMQQLAIDFFQPISKGGKQILMNMIRSRFNIDGGPLALNRLWMNTIELRVRQRIRQIQIHNRDETVEVNENDEGEAIDPFGNERAPTRVNESDLNTVLQELPRYVHSKLGNPKFRAMFDIWFDAIQEKGSDKIDMAKDVYDVLRKQGYIGNNSAMTEQFKHTIAGHILNYLKDQLGVEFLPRIKNILHLSSVEAVAYAVYHRKVAAWILGGILRAQIEAGE